MNISRRHFLVFSSSALVMLSAGNYFSKSSFIESHTIFLKDTDRLILTKLLPVILPSIEDKNEKIATLIEQIEKALLSFSFDQQKSFRALLNSMTQPVSRAMVCGIWVSWSEVKTESIQRMLERWRNSRWSIFNQAYTGIVQLSSVIYYGHPNQWALSQYTGPSSQVKAALGRL
jgi:hypothetical protein